MNDTRTTVSSGPVGRVDEADEPAPAVRPVAESDAAQAAELHTPVLLRQCLDLLAPALVGPGAPARPILIDCTLGMGGHSEAALERFENLSVIGIDRYPELIALASARLSRFGERFRAVCATYDRVDSLASDAAVSAGRSLGVVHAILMDLCVSPLQLARAER